MLNRVDVLTWAIVAAGAGLFAGAAASASAADVRPGVASCASDAVLAEGKAPCCFSHPSYSGTCQVRPAEDETCASILSYLNTALSSGKSYCSNTDIRGGWKDVACEKEKAQARATPARATDRRP